MRIALRVLAGICLLALLVVAVILVPPHLQIRRVHPALPSESELRSLAAVPDGPLRVRFLTNAAQQTSRGLLGHEIFLIEWPNGKLFMIDAGMDRETAAEFADLMGTLSGGGEARFEGTLPELLGDDIARVAGVGFTHLHIDHSAGIVPFCEARGPGAKWVRTSWQAEEHNLHTREGAELVEASCLEAQAPRGERLMTVEGFPGLGIVALGGHTPGSTLFAAHVKGQLWLFSGDITNVRENLLNNVGKGFAYSYLMVPEDTARTEELRLWLAELDARPDIGVVVSHDHPALEASGIAAYSR